MQLPCKSCRRYTLQAELTDGECKSCYRPPPPPVPEVKWDDTCPVLRALLEGLVGLSDGAFTGSGGGSVLCDRIGPTDVPGRRSVHFRVQMQTADLRRRITVDLTEAEYESFRRWCNGRSITFQEYT